MPDIVTTTDSRGLLTVLILSAVLSGCASPPPAEVIEAARPKVPSERLSEVRLTAYLASGRHRAAMRDAEDVGAWLDAYWAERDPLPATEANELLEVYRYRADYLSGRFPDIPFGEWPQPWGIFLRYGLWDARGPEFVTWGRPNEEGIARTPPAWEGGFLRQRFRYGSPENFTLVTLEGELQRQPGLQEPPGPPDLEGVWELLEDPTASVIRKRQALIDLSWYEHPDLIQRLLEVPTERLANVGGLKDEVFQRMSVRSSYRLGTEGARRLAALMAAGGTEEHALRRAAGDSYPATLLDADLDGLAQEQFRLERAAARGPHPLLWRDPEGLLERLARIFPDPDRLTGWDWRGDVYLTLGPPAFLDENGRVAHFLWSTPEVMGIGDTMLGWVQFAVLDDHISSFLQTAMAEAFHRKEGMEEAARTVSSALNRSSTIDADLIREELSVLAPSGVYRVAIPLGAENLSMTMDAVAFPAEGDSVEFQVSVGLPAGEVTIREGEGGERRTDLRVSVLLTDDRGRPVYGASRQEGYVVEGEGEMEGRFFLDVFRFGMPARPYVIYVSAQDPSSGLAGGLLQFLDVRSSAAGEGPSEEGLRISPITLATDIRPAEGEGKFIRNGLRILPAPSRSFLYGQDLYFYFEVEGMSESDVGDHVWSETFFIIPDAEGQGIIRLGSEQDRTSIEARASRSLAIDLGALEGTYQGNVFLVVLVEDKVSGERAVAATRLMLRRRSPRR
ncbi:MAG: hypothetical protein R6W82_09275 [bacterium]